VITTPKMIAGQLPAKINQWQGSTFMRTGLLALTLSRHNSTVCLQASLLV
jgi:hypothetical protein